ncbi:MAG: sodium:proton exchanger [Chloroflexota bacterium]|nr:sodium:proton exchanger [Chloroflexota bacterium]
MFVVAGVALAGLAWVVSFATDEVGQRFGPAITGFLQSTLGNLPEFFIVVFALSSGETVVARNSILGSLFSNALLVLGLAIIVGSLRSPERCMRFRTRLPNDTATLLLIASFIIVLVGLSLADRDLASRHINAISAIAAGVLLIVYGTWAVGYLRSGPAAGDGHKRRTAVSLPGALTLLAASGVGAAFVSDWFVAAVGPAVKALGVSKAFAGLVIVAIAGNAVENVTGIVLAKKGQSDLAISVVKNSVAQIAAFLFPALVLVSLLFATPLTFAIAPVYIGAVFLTAIAIWQISGDGEAQLFEGAALIALYVVVAAFAWFE